jgi:WD40 repeat protein
MGTKIAVKEYTKLEGHKQGVYSLFWHDQESVLVSAGGDGAVVKWSVPLQGDLPASGVVGTLFAQLPEPIFSLLEGREGVIWAGSQSGNVYRLKQGTSPRVLSMGASVFFLVRWMDGSIAAGLGNGEMVFMDDEMVVQRRVALGRKSLRCCLFDRGLVGGSDGCIWQLGVEGEVLNRFEANAPSVFCMVGLSDGGWVSGGRDAQLWWFDANGVVTERLNAHLYTIHALVGYGDGMIVSGGMDKMVKVWDGRDAKLLKVLDRQKFPGTGHSHSVNALCRLPALEQRGKRRLLASAGDDKIIRLWEINPE